MLKRSLIHYEPTNMLAQSVSKYGATSQELRALQTRVLRAKQQIICQADDGVQGWLSLPDDREMGKRILNLVEKKREFSQCIVIGVGGSDLGARALYAALASSAKGGGMKLLFLGSNTDPYELATKLKQIDFHETLITIISKSGDTIEPMSTFFIVREALIRTVGAKKAPLHIVAITDQGHGGLWQFSQQQGYSTLPVPSNVGGRFSVLSDVGLFPLACAGISIAGILKGAQMERDAFFDKDSSAAQFASLHYLAYTKRHQSIHVLMPYAEQLREFGFWYRQLWAESLGKAIDQGGNMLNVGPTPVAALGATDQHSQIQLYCEGPYDKTITCIEVEDFGMNIVIPKDIRAVPSLAFLASQSLTRIIHAEREGTCTALTKQQRPNGTIFLPSISVASMGALVMFFELATAVFGELLRVNTYNQPGVEAGKREMRRLLA